MSRDRQRPLLRLILLALLSVAGILGLLLTDSALSDGLLLVLAAMPLLYGAWRRVAIWRHNRASPAPGFRE